jgi:L-fuconolactonase
MPTIDVQVHAYQHNHPGRPWVGHLHGPQSANGEEMAAAMDAVGVDAAVLVSSFNLYRYDPSYALEVYATFPERFRVVTPVDPTNPGFFLTEFVARILSAAAELSPLSL